MRRRPASRHALAAPAGDVGDENVLREMKAARVWAKPTVDA